VRSNTETFSCERCKKEYSKFEMYKVNSVLSDSKEYVCKECLEYVCSMCGNLSNELPKEINNGELKICPKCVNNKEDIIKCPECDNEYTRNYWYFDLCKPSVSCIVCGNRLNL